MFLVVLFGIAAIAARFAPAIAEAQFGQALLALFPILWVLASLGLGTISSLHHKRLWLIPLAPVGIVYLLGAYLIWLLHGLPALVTGKEPERDKPTRYANVVA
jgi:hypothetical protein